MNYTDKYGNEIKEGMHILMDDGSIEEVFATMDQYGNDDLGINASNEDYLRIHNTDREYYSLCNFSAENIEILPEKEKTVRVLYVEPMKTPVVKDVKADLTTYQQMVGGLIQLVYPFSENVGVVCNDEGKLLNLPPNRFLRDENTGKPYDVLCGNFFVVGLNYDDFCSLTEDQVKKYHRMYDCERLIAIPKEKTEKPKER